MAIDFNREPYFDDYDENKKFHRILFRPGYAVQARELTQLQTILQEQISRFGDHVFENGSLVIPGAVKVLGDVTHIRLQNAAPASTDNANYEGARIENSSGVVATITTLSRSENNDPLTFYISYTTGGEFARNENLTITRNDGGVNESVTTEDSAEYTGESTIVLVQRGVYFLREQFVLVEPQSVVVSKYIGIDEIPGEISVGLLSNETFVTPEEDPSLLDNARGTSNETAPGAHRYKIDAQLVLKDDLTDLTDYNEIARIVNGEIAREAKESQYSVLGDTLAQRTYEESGDYVINNFTIGVENHPTDDTKLRLEFEPGKAYIRGYRVNITDTTRVDIDKARTTESVDGTLVPLQYGEYVHVKTVFGQPEPFTTVKLYSDATLSYTSDVPNEPSTQVGTATVKAVTYDVAQSATEGEPVFRLHLFNFEFSGSNSIADVQTFYSDVNFPVFAGEIQTASVVSGNTVLQEPSDQTSIYNLPFSEVDTVTNSSVNFFKKYASVVSGSSVTISTAIGTEQFRDEVTDYIVYVTNVVNGSTPDASIGDVNTPNSVSVSTNNQTATLDLSNFNINDNDEVEIYAVMFKSSAQIKTKTPILNSTLTTSATPGSTISLGFADVYEIVSIVDGDGNDFTSYYTLDTGQRDNYYDISTLRLRSIFAAPETELTITFNYFNHSSGDFFTVDSYSAISYEEIPTYTSQNGETYKLANSIDLRPIIDVSGNFSNSPVAFVPDTEAIVDFVYYLPRRDKICVNTEGKFFVVSGVPDLVPEEPNDINNGITLYNILLNAYTFDTDDVAVRPVRHPRYKMKDIARLEDRIENLEYYIALNNIEQDALSREFVDKFKSGILVDQFTGHNIGDAQKETYRAAIDPQLGELRAESSVKAIQLEDNEEGSNYQITGNIVTLPYDEVALITQERASKIERIQPFINFSFNGAMTLNPSSDSWVSTRRVPDTTLDGGNEFTSAFRANRNSLGTVWGSWRTFWRGNRLIRTRTGERTVRTESTEIERLGDRVVNRSAIPFIRSRVIEFTATGMKPLTDVTPFFDGIDVSNFVTPNGGSQGDQVTTDAIGSITGTFEIPNEDDTRFRTGNRVFELLDDVETTSTDASATYSATGVLEDISTFFEATTIVDIDTSNVSQSNTVRIRRPTPPRPPAPTPPRRPFRRFRDPLAQSFGMSLEDGGFITSIDVYFGPIPNDNEFGVTLQIRNMENGFPGAEIAPYGSITLSADEIGPGSEDSTIPTRFNFPSPVYLEDGEEYCFVILSDSEELTVWTSEMGEEDVLTGETISRQPFLGSLFKSQNNSTWTPAQLEDLKFQINRAQFNTNVTGQIIFENSVSVNDSSTEADPYIEALDSSPLIFKKDSNYIKVLHPNHSMIDGDTVRLTSPNPSSLAGIPANEIFDVDLTVSDGPLGEPIKPDEYYIQVTTTATSNSRLGGNGIIATQNVSFSTIHPVVETQDYPNTRLNWEFKGIDKFTRNPDGEFVNITAGEDNYLKTSRTSVASGDGSVIVRGTLESDRNNMTPFIDIKRFALLTVENRINNLEDTNSVSETDEAADRYMTKPVELVNPANEIRVFFDANRPSGTNIDVYYKVRKTGSSELIDDQPWIKIQPDNYGEITESFDAFREYSYTNSYDDDFNIYAIKIVMRSTDDARVPRIRALRVIAIKD